MKKIPLKHVNIIGCISLILGILLILLAASLLADDCRTF